MDLKTIAITLLISTITSSTTSARTTTTPASPTGSQNRNTHIQTRFNPTQCLPIDPIGKADTNGVNEFGFSVFKQLAKSGNVFISPFNLWSALSLAYLGAEGETKLQMRRLLGIRGKKNTLEFLNGLESELSGRYASQKNLSLEAASKIYMSWSFPINSCLRSALSDRLQTIDFSKLTEAANTINTFVNTTTKGLIPSIVQPDQLTSTKMAVISAIYFYGAWDLAFDPSLTSPQPFQRGANPRNKENVPMMFMKSTMLLGKANQLSARVLRLPYSGGDVSMYILLPFEAGNRGFETTLRSLDASTLQGAINGLSEALVQVRIPKFKMEGKYEEDLMETLQSLGATLMFDKQLANFTSFSRNVFVSTIAHKSYIDVSESGTEAAAATAVLLDLRSSRAEAEPFTCDRPFIFVIHDDVEKVVLFVGTYRTPPPTA